MTDDDSDNSFRKRWVMLMEGILPRPIKKSNDTLPTEDDNSKTIDYHKPEEQRFPAILDDESDIVEKAKKKKVN